MLKDASGSTGCRRSVQERVAREEGEEGRVAPRGYPREGAGKFFPLGCRQKGNYFNCGQPRSTKLHPVFLLPPSLPLSLAVPLCLPRSPSMSTCELLTLIPSLSSVASRALSFSHPFSLLRFVGEHIPPPAAASTATAGVSRLACVYVPGRSLRASLESGSLRIPPPYREKTSYFIHRYSEN